MTDYWLNKLFFDLQGPGGKERWRDDRAAVLDDYPLKPELRQALLDDDFSVIQPVANAYLLRFHLLISGYDDEQSIALLKALEKEEETANG
jgi:protocatechuate 4,5-dioxygenase alpha chain